MEDFSSCLHTHVICQHMEVVLLKIKERIEILIIKSLKRMISFFVKYYLIHYTQIFEDFSFPSLLEASNLQSSFDVSLDPLEKEVAIHSSTLAWKIPWMEEPDRLQSMGLQRVRHD